MNGSLKNLFVGIFVLGAITILVCTIMFLKPSVGDERQTIYVRFSDINRITVGTRVLFGGRPVGEVAAIEEIKDARSQPTDELGRVYFYQLTLKIDSKTKVFNTDEITLQTSGLLGEKSIAIIPKAPPLGVTPQLVTNQPVYADSVDPFQNALVEFSELSGSMEEAFKGLSKWITQHGESLASSIQSFGSASSSIDQVATSINEEKVISSMKKSIDQFGDTLSQVEKTICELEEKETFTNVAAAVKNLKNASRNFELVSQDLVEGKGTLGRLLVDEDLYLNTNAILTKVNTLINDINHYGLLFHLNKRWQRIRVQKVGLQNALHTPQSFRAYFEEEVDEISTAMGRLSMLIQQAKESCTYECVFQSEEFKRDFAQLLRQADQLSDNLRLYNQQLLNSSSN